MVARLSSAERGRRSSGVLGDGDAAEGFDAEEAFGAEREWDAEAFGA
jgi:hypothetical protein